MILEYLDDEPVTLDEVKWHLRLDIPDDDEFISSVIIPSARRMAESITGAAIRKARYRETLVSGGTLGVGNVLKVESVEVEGKSVLFKARLHMKRTVLEFNGGNSADVIYTAGLDIADYESVKSWILLATGYLYENRSLAVLGSFSVNQMPRNITNQLIHQISLPTGF